MYITAKLPPSSPHFNHGTILRTGIYPALYFLFSILLLFLSLKHYATFRLAKTQNMFELYVLNHF